ILVEMIKLVPEYCRVMRVMREIPPAYLVAGLKRIDLRTEVEKELKKDLKNIFEIRMREVGFRNTDDFNTSIKVSEYPASNGKELFLQVVNSENVLFGLLRLRFPGSPSPLIPELNDCAIVREVHVYGKALRLGESNDDDNTAQHGGLGKELMKKAEELSKSNGFKKLAVISGVGVRPYYEKLGYELVGMYMVKVLQ
ncbi:tRNA uridine(34) 5-carboxymethylaminomethyl modification radical SAM/GNAT enzyme Elp3, partial [Candidatus Pacearchaeota archaeon CG10_big_fil_rev_8_21_14_0_10_35_13]